MPYSLTLARAALHLWEEPCISGEEGSGTIFFSGCQLRCSYCQNYSISHERFGKSVTPLALSKVVKELEIQGANNINLVSPTQFLPLIKEALYIYRPCLPIIFNSGGYESVETLEEYKDIFDIFLFDFKYWSSERAQKYSSAFDYPDVARKAILKASEIAGAPRFDDRGIMKKGVIIRHLLLPMGTLDAINIMNWVKLNCPHNLFSLMNQYTVMPWVKDKELGRKVTFREYEKVSGVMLELGLKGYTQESSSSSGDFIPDFDLTGI